LDNAGRLIKEIQSDGSTATWTRDPNSGYVTSQTDFLGRVTSFVNDAQGYVTQETLPDGTQLSYVYGDAFHDLTSMTDARGGVTSNAYDAQGNLLSTTAPDGGVTSYGYDANGLMTSTTDPLGNTTLYAQSGSRNQRRELPTAFSRWIMGFAEAPDPSEKTPCLLLQSIIPSFASTKTKSAAYSLVSTG
jgi:YD repeat-containing protein